MTRTGLAAIAAATLTLLAGVSLVTTGVCACASVAQAAVTYHWTDDVATLRGIVEKRYAKGALEADVVAANLGRSAYQKYCKQIERTRETACLLPHDRNFWRKRAVQLTLTWDNGRALSSVTAVPHVKYVWE